MGAATINVILGAAQLLEQRSRSLTVRSPSKAALRVLELCGLTAIVEPEPNVAHLEPG
jgi:anti-anti-sigma regulatory factor